MISMKLIHTIALLAVIAFSNNAIAMSQNFGTVDGWNLSVDADNVHKHIDTSKPEFQLIDNNNSNEKAAIIPSMLGGSETFDNRHLQDFLEQEMNARGLTNTSSKLREIASANGIAGKGYDNEGSWMYLAYFPVWPSDLVSNRAILIVSTLGDNRSAKLFNTINIILCPGRKMPLTQLLNSSRKNVSHVPAQLATSKHTSPQKIDASSNI